MFGWCVEETKSEPSRVFSDHSRVHDRNQDGLCRFKKKSHFTLNDAGCSAHDGFTKFITRFEWQEEKKTSSIDTDITTRLLEPCPVCQELVRSPLYGCPNLHVHCKTCAVKIIETKDVCSVCRTSGLGPSGFLDKQREHLVVDCPHTGCTFACATGDLASKMEAHQSVCPSRPLACMFHKDNVYVKTSPRPLLLGTCDFRGSWMQMITHLQTQHQLDCRPLATTWMEFEGADSPSWDYSERKESSAVQVYGDGHVHTSLVLLDYLDKRSETEWKRTLVVITPNHTQQSKYIVARVLGNGQILGHLHCPSLNWEELCNKTEDEIKKTGTEWTIDPTHLAQSVDANGQWTQYLVVKNSEQGLVDPDISDPHDLIGFGKREALLLVAQRKRLAKIKKTKESKSLVYKRKRRSNDDGNGSGSGQEKKGRLYDPEDCTLLESETGYATEDEAKLAQWFLQLKPLDLVEFEYHKSGNVVWSPVMVVDNVAGEYTTLDLTEVKKAMTLDEENIHKFRRLPQWPGDQSLRVRKCSSEAYSLQDVKGIAKSLRRQVKADSPFSLCDYHHDGHWHRACMTKVERLDTWAACRVHILCHCDNSFTFPLGSVFDLLPTSVHCRIAPRGRFSSADAKENKDGHDGVGADVFRNGSVETASPDETAFERKKARKGKIDHWFLQLRPLDIIEYATILDGHQQNWTPVMVWDNSPQTETTLDLSYIDADRPVECVRPRYTQAPAQASDHRSQVRKCSPAKCFSPGIYQRISKCVENYVELCGEAPCDFKHGGEWHHDARIKKVYTVTSRVLIRCSCDGFKKDHLVDVDRLFPGPRQCVTSLCRVHPVMTKPSSVGASPRPESP